jgi:hypothetical protein
MFTVANLIKTCCLEGAAYDLVTSLGPERFTEWKAALINHAAGKGVIDYCLAGVLRSQVRHHFHLFTVRVATKDNIFADALSRGDLPGFLEALSHSGNQPIRLRLSAAQRSTAAYAAVKAAFMAA